MKVLPLARFVYYTFEIVKTEQKVATISYTFESSQYTPLEISQVGTDIPAMKKSATTRTMCACVCSERGGGLYNAANVH